MATTVKQITESFESEVATILPAYAELDFKWDFEKNNYYNNKQRFGVIAQGAFNSPTITKAVTLQQTFNLILTTEFLNQDDTDQSQSDGVFELWDALNEVSAIVVANKLGLPNQVFNTELSTIDEPVFAEDGGVVILVASFLVTYRTPLL